MSSRRQQGFSLVELMVVSALIGTIATLAIPTYTRMVAESEVGSGLATITGLKTNVDYLYGYGKTGAEITPEALGANPAANPLGTIESTFAEDGTGSLRFRFDGNSSPKVLGSVLSLTRSANGRWNCSISGPAAEHKPATCV